jgi:GxxExxY protein
MRLNHEGHEGHEEEATVAERTARAAIDAGLKVHKLLGPGLLESAYEHCLAHELYTRRIPVQRQVALPVVYGDVTLDAGYRLDLLVASAVVIEVKAVEKLTNLHEAQLLTYLKLSGHRIGLLMNFNVVLFRQGLKRLVR